MCSWKEGVTMQRTFFRLSFPAVSAIRWEWHGAPRAPSRSSRCWAASRIFYAPRFAMAKGKSEPSRGRNTKPWKGAQIPAGHQTGLRHSRGLRNHRFVQKSQAGQEKITSYFLEVLTLQPRMRGKSRLFFSLLFEQSFSEYTGHPPNWKFKYCS